MEPCPGPGATAGGTARSNRSWRGAAWRAGTSSTGSHPASTTVSPRTWTTSSWSGTTRGAPDINSYHAISPQTRDQRPHHTFVLPDLRQDEPKIAVSQSVIVKCRLVPTECLSVSPELVRRWNNTEHSTSLIIIKTSQ